MNKRFNIRVYGILTNDRNEVLISDEYRWEKFFTKFPGGGLEWGEGLKECLQREFKEELKLDIEVGEIFYVTDFFQQSAWLDTDQIISIYYQITCSEKNTLQFESYQIPFNAEQEKYRWLSLSEISENSFTFPIDKIVGKILREKLSK
ncbi:MAG: NUDIX domain-containing protein [Bacteroidetes bacterium]|nr:NUDIX domain-containing protein [Bacteroidota bacterium]